MRKSGSGFWVREEDLSQLSYDIFAFAAEGVPADDVSLLEWFKKQAEWSEPHSYDDAAVTTPALSSFYRELIGIYPPLNGSDAPEWDDDIECADYAIGYSIIYVAFGWPVAAQARNVVLRLGAEHKVGVCEISEVPSVIHRPPTD
ncbi:hypothetical protein EV580_6654 [Mycobacterium sp. BK086]|nr:hypothetical protein EV580_6654 [Mycobacterium sp. BK086]